MSKKRLSSKEIYSKNQVLVNQDNRGKYNRFKYIKAGIPKDFLDLNVGNMDQMKATFNGDIISASELLEVWTRNLQDIMSKGRGMIFQGDVGLGKSAMAAILAKRLIDITSLRNINYSVNYCYWGEHINDFFLSWENPSYKSKIQKVYNVDYLILDDVGTGDRETNNKAIVNHFRSIIKHRAIKGKPTLITMNIDLDRLEEYNDDFSRTQDVIREKNLVFQFFGESYRKVNQKNNIDNFQNELNKLREEK
jgi:DNA replication protein DnaC